jgi:hypothetical protein
VYGGGGGGAFELLELAMRGASRRHPLPMPLAKAETQGVKKKHKQM